MSKIGYLDFTEAQPFYKAAKECPDLPVRLLTAFLPDIWRPQETAVRLDHKIAALRVIEALRLYAAAHDGALPDALDRVTEVPVPLDPATGKPFDYRRDGAAALLSCPPTDLSPPWPSYRITIRPADGPKK